MDEQALLVFLQQMLAEHYGQSDGAFHSLNTRSLDDGRVVYTMYRIDLRDQSSWVLCAAHEDLIASHTFQWERQETACTWLMERAKILTALTAQHYPVPQVVLTRTDAAVVQSGPWSVLVTSWIAGRIASSNRPLFHRQERSSPICIHFHLRRCHRDPPAGIPRIPFRTPSRR